MAAAYSGADPRNGPEIAVTVPHPEVESDPALFDRFRRAAESGGALDHPGVTKSMPGSDSIRLSVARHG